MRVYEKERGNRETLGVGGDHHLRQVLLPSRSRPPPPSRRRMNRLSTDKANPLHVTLRSRTSLTAEWT